MRILKFTKYLSLARISSGATVFVAAAFLVSAILTDNGGTIESGDDILAEEQGWIDPVITGDVPDKNDQSLRRIYSAHEPSVMSLIDAHSQSVPSSSVGRISVTVQPGDTLSSIGLRHGLSATEVAKLNGIGAPFIIQVGQTLYIAR